MALRAIGVTLDRLLELNLQLELWEEAVPRSAFRVPRGEEPAAESDAVPSERGTRNAERGTSLQSAIDRIKTRWGTRGIRLGA